MLKITYSQKFVKACQTYGLSTIKLKQNVPKHNEKKEKINKMSFEFFFFSTLKPNQLVLLTNVKPNNVLFS